MAESVSLDIPATPVSQEVAQDVRAYLRERRPTYVDLLRTLVETETPSTEPDTQRAALDVLAAPLRALDFDISYVRGTTSGGHLYARPAARTRGAPSQLLVGHIDTVWPLGTLSRMPFVQHDGQLRGPGIYDMKSGLVQIVAALDALTALGLDPPATPVVFVNSDEEIGSADSERWIVRLARAAERAFVLEPSLGPEGRLKTARAGVGRFNVVVRGRGSHAGLAPEEGTSAILELSHVVQALHHLNDYKAGVSVNVGMIEGGQRANVVAPEARAVVDVRVPTMADARRIEAAILGIEAVTPGASVEITGSVARPPLEPTPRNRRLWERAVEAGHLLGLDLIEGMAGGGSDGNTTSRFTATLDGLGAVGDGAHADHEFIELDGLDERAALLALLLLAPIDDAGPDLP